MISKCHTLPAYRLTFLKINMLAWKNFADIFMSSSFSPQPSAIVCSRFLSRLARHISLNDFYSLQDTFIPYLTDQSPLIPNPGRLTLSPQGMFRRVISLNDECTSRLISSGINPSLSFVPTQCCRSDAVISFILFQFKTSPSYTGSISLHAPKSKELQQVYAHCFHIMHCLQPPLQA